MRKRQRHNNKTTKATQRIDYDRAPDPKSKRAKAKPRGRSVGGPWVRRR